VSIGTQNRRVKCLPAVRGIKINRHQPQKLEEVGHRQTHVPLRSTAVGPAETATAMTAKRVKIAKRIVQSDSEDESGGDKVFFGVVVQICPQCRPVLIGFRRLLTSWGQCVVLVLQ
jgi:hypothetical protein